MRSSVTPAPFNPASLTASSSVGSQSIAAGARFILPAGFYVVNRTDGGGGPFLYHEAFMGTWYIAQGAVKESLVVISDGVNVSIRNIDTVSHTLTWRKFG